MIHDHTLALTVSNERGKPCQDHAVALRGRSATVACVADGVSRTGLNASLTQCGAVLTAQTAAVAAVRQADTPRADPHLVGEAVRAALSAVYAPIVSLHGGDARHMLSSTLVLGVRTEEWSALWMVGDGFCGVIVQDGLVTSEGENVVATASTGLRAVCRGVHLDSLAECDLATGLAARPSWGPTLFVRGRTEALWVATDGLWDEWPLAFRLSRRGTLRNDEARALLTRPPKADDLGVAVVGDIGWALTRELEVRGADDLAAAASGGCGVALE